MQRALPERMRRADPPRAEARQQPMQLVPQVSCCRGPWLRQQPLQLLVQALRVRLGGWPFRLGKTQPGMWGQRLPLCGQQRVQALAQLR